jgi:hypothetical protein
MQMLNDSVKAMDLDEKIEVIDMASLVLQSLGPAPEAEKTAAAQPASGDAKPAEAKPAQAVDQPVA